MTFYFGELNGLEKNQFFFYYFNFIKEIMHLFDIRCVFVVFKIFIIILIRVSIKLISFAVSS